MCNDVCIDFQKIARERGRDAGFLYSICNLIRGNSNSAVSTSFDRYTFSSVNCLLSMHVFLRFYFYETKISDEGCSFSCFKNFIEQLFALRDVHMCNWLTVLCVMLVALVAIYK